MGPLPGGLWEGVGELCPGEAQSEQGKCGRDQTRHPLLQPRFLGHQGLQHNILLPPETPGSPIRLSGFSWPHPR